MRQTTFFAVMANFDTTEGRGPTFFTGIGFDSRKDAIAFVQGQTYARKWGVMGTPGDDCYVQEMVVSIYTTLDECNAGLPAKFREERRIAALRKLSAEDREALGL